MSDCLFIRNVIHRKKTVCIRIRNGIFETIEPGLVPEDGETVIDCASRYAVLPPFYNGHTHAAMTILRGYADDQELFTWLNESIWPVEAKMTPDDVYAGARLAILEMIRSGTVFFNDSYWFPKAALRAAEEMGIRACIGMLRLSQVSQETEKENQWLLENRSGFSPRIRIAFSPHAIYTVDTKTLAETARLAGENPDVFLHIHLSETRKEFEDALNQYGKTPVFYLDSLGLLTPKTILAHAVHLTEPDMDLLHTRGAVAVHNPCSNMKLTSGGFAGPELMRRGCRLALGTDGACSNNNLSMLDEMKFAALLAKHKYGDPEVMPASAVFDMATKDGAAAFGLHAGVIEEGWDADCILVDLDAPPLVPGHNLISDMVYSADPACIDTVICRGRILMEHRKIEGEKEIIDDARKAVRRLFSR